MTMRTPVVLRSGCRAPRHDSDQAYRKAGCRCPKARAAEVARKAKYDAYRAAYHAFQAHLRLGGHSQPGVPPFFTNPARRCANVDPDVMFPAEAADLPAAKKVCRNCPFAAACHAWAVETVQAWGVWGGVGELERRRIIFARRQRAVAA